jgi:hypothetical protein
MKRTEKVAAAIAISLSSVAQILKVVRSVEIGMN